MITWNCQRCGGNGWLSVSDHAPDCDGDTCRNCPIERQEPCPDCGGAGHFEEPDNSEEKEKA